MMISLPAKWVKEFEFKKGDEVNIEQIENNLLISAKGIKAKKRTEIKLTGFTESAIRTALTNAYRLGYDKVDVFFEHQTQFKVIKDIVNTRLLGFEIIKKEKNSCKIENITEPSAEQFNILLQKILYNISELLTIAEQVINKEEPIEDFEEIEEKIQQYDNFCRRVIAKKQIAEKNAQLFWAFLTLTIHGQREVYLGLKHLSKIKEPKEVLQFFEECKTMFESLKQAYLKKDITLIEKIHDMEKDIIYNKAYPLLKKGKNTIILHHIMNAIRNFYLASSPLMGITLQQN